ncbi:MerR family transcriptional regulator [Amycolatopsis sp. EV170708-02-1]|uniref:MerR family transcriptional regulator n=1 Tax=Amycolatopsis sp. EV170708-02-1 TaxID=2919322 RepID=UPI0028F3E54D|nr:MerR family transcriptional regulator [Amycolatopsis sp. EV170708-02-1]
MVEAGSPQEPLVPVADGEQGELFPDSSLPDELVGYRGPAACQIAGITYRQLDYWARTKLVAPSIRTAHGSGSQRLYSFKDILVLKVVKRLLDTGVSLQNIRVAVDHLRLRGVRDLAKVTLFSDGTTVYECTSPEEIVDLLQGGQGVFGIAVSGAMQEISGTIHEFPAERADGGVIETVAPDELTQRRNARRTG